jgi:hypothetical protein
MSGEQSPAKADFRAGLFAPRFFSEQPEIKGFNALCDGLVSSQRRNAQRAGL